jgi:hypothetical protein
MTNVGNKQTLAIGNLDGVLAGVALVDVQAVEVAGQMVGGAGSMYQLVSTEYELGPA